MAIQLNDNIDPKAPKPLDERYQVADITERDAISSAVRYEGMQCYVQSEEIVYFLKGGIDNANWTQIGSGFDEQEITNIISTSSYVQQVVYVDPNGNDETAEVNNPNLPFASMKVAIGQLTAANCVLRINEGTYFIPTDANLGDILQDLDPFVASLTIDSRATLIECHSQFINANQSSLLEFNFYGNNTDIISNNQSAIFVTGQRISKCQIICNNITAAATPLTLIHPGTNDVLVNNLTALGIVAGYCISIRGFSDSRVFVKGDLIQQGVQNNFAGAIAFRQNDGNINITVNGKILDSSTNGTGVIFAEANPTRNATIKVLGGIEYSGTGNRAIIRVQNIAGADLNVEADITQIEGSGGISVMSCTTTNFITNVRYKGTVNAHNSSLLFSNGAGQLNAYFDGIFNIENIFGNQLVNITSTNTRTNLFLKGVYNILDTKPFFNFPATINNFVNIYTDNIQIEYDQDGVDLFLQSTLNGTVLLQSTGTFRTNADSEFPNFVDFKYLNDLTLSQITQGGAGGVTNISFDSELEFEHFFARATHEQDDDIVYSLSDNNKLAGHTIEHIIDTDSNYNIVFGEIFKVQGNIFPDTTNKITFYYPEEGKRILVNITRLEDKLDDNITLIEAYISNNTRDFIIINFDREIIFDDFTDITVTGGFNITEIRRAGVNSISLQLDNIATNTDVININFGINNNLRDLRQVSIGEILNVSVNNLIAPSLNVKSFQPLSPFNTDIWLSNSMPYSNSAGAISFWVRMVSFSNTAQEIFSYSHDGPELCIFAIRLMVTTGGAGLRVFRRSDFVISPFQRSADSQNNIINSGDNDWHHVVVNSNFGQPLPRVYVDGVEITMVAFGSSSGAQAWLGDYQLFSLQNPKCLIGSIQFNGSRLNYLRQAIDQLVIWDEELTQAEINELYNSGSWMDSMTHSKVNNAISIFEFDDSVVDLKGFITNPQVAGSGGFYSSNIP